MEALLQAAVPSPCLITSISLCPACPKIWAVTLQKSWPVMRQGEFMLSSSEECRSDYFALTVSQNSHFLYKESKTAWKDSKDRNCRCSFLSVSFLRFKPSSCHVIHVPAGQAVQAAVSQQLQCLIKVIIR